MDKQGIYFQHIDSLRFVAFLLVFWHHGFSWIFENVSFEAVYLEQIVIQVAHTGSLGVNIFFVISGFLISLLLRKELLATGKLKLIHFYIRRILRIWPLYYGFLIIALFVLPYLFNTFTFEGSYLLNLCFLNNFDMNHFNTAVGVMWSVAIEEQFYIFCPIILILFRQSTQLLIVSIVLFLVTLIYSLIYNDAQPFATLSNLHYLFIGTIIGQLYALEYSFFRSRFFTKRMLFISASATLLLYFTANTTSTMHVASNILLPFTIAHSILCLTQLSENPAWYWLSNLGKQTYGMYVFHYTILMLLYTIFSHLHSFSFDSIFWRFFITILALILTMLCANVSYRYFEKPFLRLKTRYS